MKREKLCLTCKSCCGFQSESKMIQVSAAVKLIPNPPARVESKKILTSGSVLKLSMLAWRSMKSMDPSSLENLNSW